MRRRDFLIGSAAVLAAARTGRAQAPARSVQERIAIMTYSFSRILKLPGRPAGPNATLDFDDLPAMFADRYKVHNLEIQHGHFLSTEPSYFKDFLARLAKTKSRVTNINLELGAMNISSPDPALRAQAVDLTKAWVNHAVALGCPRVMINQGPLSEENKQTAIETLRIMSDYGRSRQIAVGAEPRGGGGGRRGGEAPAGPPPPPAYLLLTEVVKAAGATTVPDIGNFGGDQATQHAGMRAMFPLTNGNCHIKVHEPPRYDLAAAIRLTKELGYTGLYSIEFENPSDPYAGVQLIYDALIANL
jgi:sugar phosphate isomerase/epimerase